MWQNNMDEIIGSFVLASLGDASLKATTFPYSLRQPTEKIDKNLTPYENSLIAIDIEEQMINNKYAKAVVRQELKRTQLCGQKANNLQYLYDVKQWKDNLKMSPNLRSRTTIEKRINSTTPSTTSSAQQPPEELSSGWRSNKTPSVAAPEERLKKLYRKSPAAYRSLSLYQIQTLLWLKRSLD